LQNRVYILLPPRWQNYFTTFCICWTPTLRLKMTATDPAFRWCRLLVLVLWFSQRKCCVCPKKVGEMAFFGCSEFQWTKFTWKLLLELKRYLSKVKVLSNAWTVGFQMDGLEKQCCSKIRVLFWHFAQKCTCSWILRKTIFFGKSLFSPWNVCCD